MSKLNPEDVNLGLYGDRIDTNRNNEILNLPGTQQHALTVFDGKIYDWDARPGNPFNAKIMKRTFLLDVNKFFLKKKLLAQGEKEKADNIVVGSSLMQDLTKEFKKQKRIVEAGYEPIHRTLGSAAVGNTINTAYEVVRRINYLTNVTSPEYNMANFNAKNAFEVVAVTNLNAKGFTKDALPTGEPEIGDHVTPDVAKLTYSPFEKSIFADSFRYEFTQREVSDSVFSLEAQIQKDIPGVFAKMEDDKCTTLLNAVTSAGAVSPKWDAVSGNFYTGDAAKDLEDAEVALDNYGSGNIAMMPRDTLRAYLKNIQSAINTLAPTSLQKPDAVRTGILPRNPNLTYFVNNSITSKTYVVVSNPSWGMFMQGPKVNVSYKNQMTPGQIEGRILFSFNGVKVKLAAASTKKTAVIS